MFRLKSGSVICWSIRYLCVVSRARRGGGRATTVHALLGPRQTTSQIAIAAVRPCRSGSTRERLSLCASAHPRSLVLLGKQHLCLSACKEAWFGDSSKQLVPRPAGTAQRSGSREIVPIRTVRFLRRRERGGAWLPPAHEGAASRSGAARLLGSSPPQPISPFCRVGFKLASQLDYNQRLRRGR